MEMSRCQGFLQSGKRCKTRLRNGNSLYCCDKHKPKNYASIKEECTMCLMELEDDDIYTLKCGHGHHKDCLAKWILIPRYGEPYCPMCRAFISKSLVALVRGN